MIIHRVRSNEDAFIRRVALNDHDCINVFLACPIHGCHLMHCHATCISPTPPLYSLDLLRFPYMTSRIRRRGLAHKSIPPEDFQYNWQRPNTWIKPQQDWSCHFPPRSCSRWLVWVERGVVLIISCANIQPRSTTSFVMMEKWILNGSSLKSPWKKKEEAPCSLNQRHTWASLSACLSVCALHWPFPVLQTSH